MKWDQKGLRSQLKPGLEAFLRLAEEGKKYFSVSAQEVEFKPWVGAFVVNGQAFEVLPKLDRLDRTEGQLQAVLVQMLLATGHLRGVHQKDWMGLDYAPGGILEWYFEEFLKEVEGLLQRGLVRCYQQREGQVLALKGQLRVGKHFAKNAVHQERFYTRHKVFSFDHIRHRVLVQALKALADLACTSAQKDRAARLLQRFPPQSAGRLTERDFKRLRNDRRTMCYQKGIDLARMILLELHPQVKTGRHHAFGMLFNMETLWQRFVEQVVKSCFSRQDESVELQPEIPFWNRNGLKKRIQKPDILIRRPHENLVLDAKWVLPEKQDEKGISLDYIRQMYTYQHLCQARQGLLLLPWVERDIEAEAAKRGDGTSEVEHLIS